jgi:hypothetical protein
LLTGAAQEMEKGECANRGANVMLAARES